MQFCCKLSWPEIVISTLWLSWYSTYLSADTGLSLLHPYEKSYTIRNSLRGVQEYVKAYFQLIVTVISVIVIIVSGHRYGSATHKDKGLEDAEAPLTQAITKLISRLVVGAPSRLSVG